MSRLASAISRLSRPLKYLFVVAARVRACLSFFLLAFVLGLWAPVSRGSLFSRALTD